VSGDGQLAANRFLGEEGRPLHIEPDALKELRRLNSGFVLNNPTRVQRIFAAESVYLGKLGGYDQDVGANSTVEEQHLTWAKRQPLHVVAECPTPCPPAGAGFRAVTFAG
jgi:hypothetical protein